MLLHPQLYTPFCYDWLGRSIQHLHEIDGYGERVRIRVRAEGRFHHRLDARIKGTTS